MPPGYGSTAGIPTVSRRRRGSAAPRYRADDSGPGGATGAGELLSARGDR
ncbi:hypothetical protein EBESD8_33450 [Rhodococcus aetherivorans]|nr:hypothetical protein EBESD8_33450 [Rhodococcus aetherivorans]